MALADDQKLLLEELSWPDGVIYGKLQGLVFLRWRVRRHPAENLVLQYAWSDARSWLGMTGLQMKCKQQ